MIAWLDQGDYPFDDGPDPLTPSDNQPWENRYYAKHEEIRPAISPRTLVETHTAKEWHRIDGTRVACVHCGEEGYGLSCGSCGLPMREGLA